MTPAEALAQRRTYPIKVVFAARHYHGGGWQPAMIRTLLARDFGVAPSIATIRRWCIAKEHNLEQKTTLRRNRTRTEARRLAKLQEMRARGATFKSIAIAAELFMGWELSEYQVRCRLAEFGGTT